MKRLINLVNLALWSVSISYGNKGRAMPQAARAATASQPSLFHVSGRAGIAIAAFCAVYFGGQLLRGAL